jgi:serine/threonine protein kinase
MTPMRPTSLVGERLGRYTLQKLIGSGGVAHVFLAEGDRGERVALKLLRPELLRKRTLVARFEREAAVGALVKHPNVLEITPVERSADDLRWFVMELLEGTDLADELAARRTLTAPHAVRVAIGLADGLAAAHAVGVIHRDLKPENAYLVRAPDQLEGIKVLDFGFAWILGAGDDIERPRLTTRGGFVGTPEYVAPEQAQGALGHPTADIYSLGVLLYESIVGHVPFRGATWLETVQLHAAGNLTDPPGISPRLARALRIALAKDPRARFQTMKAFESALLSTPESEG